MANYIVSDTDLTSVANAIRTKSGTSAQLSFPTGFNTAIANIPTGGLPVITGSFTAGTAGTVQTIDVSYTGNGYPLAIICIVTNGEDNAEPYNTATLTKNHGSCVLVKANPALTPTFKTGDSNAGTVFSHHRTSSSAQGSSGAYGVAYTSSTNPSGSTSTTSTIKVSAKNQFKIYVSSGNGVYGFYAGQKYDYWIMYSE